MKISKDRLVQIIQEELNEIDREELLATHSAETSIARLEEEISTLEGIIAEKRKEIENFRMNITSGEKTQHDIDRRGVNE